MKNQKAILLMGLAHVFLLCTIASQSALAQTDRSKAPPEAVEKWKDLRFGMFIHWGPVSLTGYEIGWSRGDQTPIEEYDSLYLRFNPHLFDAKKWVQVAKAAGMKYIVLTTKHHDGFCLWPSKYTKYDISETPFFRDIVGELAKACREEGMGFGTYYSVCDWWHPDYPKGGRAGTEDKPGGNLDKYIEYLQNQTSELVENYGPLTCMWFDVPRLVEAHHNEPTIKNLRALQPNLLVNNRAYYDENVADFETPEQNLGTFNTTRPWETNMTIARQWAWKPNDEVKSLSQCIEGLIYSAGGDGNFLFNVGPNALGEIEANQIKRLEEMGAWINQYSEGIYGTRGGPFKPSGWGASTHKGNVIYLYIVRWQEDGKLSLPMNGNTILKAENLSGKEIHLIRGNTASVISVPEESRDEIATVIRLTIDNPASELTPVDMGTISASLAYKMPSTSSSIRWNQIEAQGPHQAFDDNPGSHWVPDGQENEWIEVDLEEIQTVDSISIEQQQAHYEKLMLQFEQDGDWVTLFSDSTGVDVINKSFFSQRARKFRIVILGGNTHLSEFQLFKSSNVSDFHVPRNQQLLTSYRPMFANDFKQISYEDLDNDGDPDILKSFINGDTPVMWIDDDDDMQEGDLEGDLDSDCLLVDRNKDGKYGHAMDFIVDFGDEDGDGDADIQVIADNVELNKTGRAFFPGHYMIVVDTDDDKVFNYINWNKVLIKCWAKSGHSHFFEDYLGQSLFLKMHAQTASIRDLSMNWENPFLFYDPDNDNISEYTVRVSDSPELLEKDVPHPEDGKIKDENRRLVFDGFIDRADIAVDLDNDNAPGNEFDFDMSLRFAGKGYSYKDQVHVFKSMKGLEGTDKYFYDKRWRNNEVLLYPDHETAYDLSLNKGEWDYCWFVFDEDDDCARWERVELYEPLNLFKIGQNNGGLDNNRQSDAAGDRGEFDQDNSGKGNLYIGKFDGRIHLHGAEWGAWRIDQEAEFYQGYGGIYNGSNLRDQKEPDKFATIKYEDSNDNGFLDKIMYDLDGDTIFEKTILLSELGINDECKVFETGKMEYTDYHNLHREATEDLWEQAQKAILVAKKYGLNTDWYANIMSPNSIREKYHYGYWLNFYIHMDLINMAMMKKEDALITGIEKAYYSGDWEILL